MSNKLKVGIIGCGCIFPMHAYSVNLLDCAEIIAVCDTDKEKLHEKTKEFSCHGYTNYKKMIDESGIDVVHICSPHYLHPEMAIYALERKKHVLTEKPMSIHLADAKAMIQAAEDHSVTLGVVFQNRFSQAALLIKEHLESNKLGKLYSQKLWVTWARDEAYYTQSSWRGSVEKEGGGVVINQAIHTLDMARWFADSNVKYVNASVNNREHPYIQVEDEAAGIIGFENGSKINFFVTNSNTQDATVEIVLHCEKGMARLYGDKSTIQFNDGKTITVDPDAAKETAVLESVGKDYWGICHSKQISQFYKSVLEKEPLFISSKDAMKTQEMVCAIFESGRKNVKIEL